MKDYSMPRKYHKDSREQLESESRHPENDGHSFKHVLKERYHKESMNDERNKKRDKEKDSKQHLHKRDKRSVSPHHKSHHRSSPINSKEQSKSSHRQKDKKHSEESESYEELSRRKRKLESELRALDLEEAAEKEAENKKVKRDKSKHKHKEENDIKIKEETLSGDERVTSKKNEQSNFPLKDEKNKNKSKIHASKFSEDKSWGTSKSESKKVEKEKPNFGVSGKLAEDTNTYNGIVIKYNEPPEARKPRRRWRLYPFKGESDLPFIPIHRQSAYLFGRTRLIADIPIDHPSCSKQHAVLQYRLIPYKREDGTSGKRIRPYIIDLESSNGTFVNNNKIEPRCYVELMERDVIKFGYSSREYVILHEESKNDEDDDDVVETNETE